MSESAKAILGGLIFLGLIGVFFVWFAAGIPSTGLVWSLRILLPLIVIGSALSLFWATRRADIAPDFIHQLLGKPFERDGACFIIFLSVRDGVCYFNIAFQNQYEKPCNLRVVAQPPMKSFSFGKRSFPGIAVDIPCAGGAFGLARVPIAIPIKHQGQKTRFEVAAATHYPGGRGTLLRFRNGLRVGKADSSGLGSAALTLGLLSIGVISISRPASTTLQLPSNVAEALPRSAQLDLQTLWQGDDGPELTEADLQRAINAIPRAQAA